MQRRWSGFARFAAVASLAMAAACQDMPTGPAPVAVPPALNQGAHTGQVPVICSLGSARVSALGFDWYRRQDTLWLPRADLDPVGRTVEYRFAANNRDGMLAFGANCAAVPFTENALRRVDRRFLVRDGGGAEQFRARQSSITLQGCVQTEQGCLLEGVTVVATPQTDQPEIDPCDYDPSCWNDYGVGGGDGDGGSEGADGPDGTGCQPGDVNCNGDAHEEGPGAFALCVAAKLGVGGWVAIGGSAFSAYQVWDARNSTREAETRYNHYNMLAGHDPAIARLYYQMWQDAQDSESMMWKALAFTSGVAVAEIGRAALACSAAALLPV